MQSAFELTKNTTILQNVAVVFIADYKLWLPHSAMLEVYIQDKVEKQEEKIT